jgi:large subunit ribosomal protein L9
MKVFMKKDVPQVGKAGTMLTIPDGYARNYLLPNGLAIEVTEKNESSLKQILQKKITAKEHVIVKTSLIAEKIKNLHLTLKKKMHDDGKLYGAVNAHEILELLMHNDIKITKSQVVFAKSIKTKGTFPVTIELTGQLKATFLLDIISE